MEGVSRNDILLSLDFITEDFVFWLKFKSVIRIRSCTWFSVNFLLTRRGGWRAWRCNRNDVGIFLKLRIVVDHVACLVRYTWSAARVIWSEVCTVTDLRFELNLDWCVGISLHEFLTKLNEEVLTILDNLVISVCKWCEVSRYFCLTNEFQYWFECITYVEGMSVRRNSCCNRVSEFFVDSFQLVSVLVVDSLSDVWFIWLGWWYNRYFVRILH